ncbi:ATP-binding protein [Aquabacterium sp. OR-4]|uniref:ATP-binding protein n=1 Tax=Aquabacterium sp. OR-4 TaxID=2978127 RepID=UPI0021B47BC3|nr:ATP-binding protein [Aquabacterium sp. OR-4]MDT7838045.1 ATP-binding protein [Aquabacterium sp. OR-4]
MALLRSLRSLPRPGITVRLFLAVLGTAGLVVLAMGLAAHWSFSRGFIGFLNHQAVLRMEAALPRLAQAWRSQGSWEFVRDRPDVWFELVGVGPPRPHRADPPPPGPMPPMLASDLLGAGRRLTLLDAQRQRVMGFPLILAETVQREIVVDGQTVGWITIAPLQSVTDDAALRFEFEQLRASLLAGLMALLLAALIAWWVARTLLAPVRAVAAATHRLAAGRHDTRVAVTGHDEVAQLGQDFNQLALTLERNEQTRRDFMADVSHELRTPLAVLRGELEAMEDGVHAPTPEALRLLQAEVRTLTQLVGDLHELALADVGALSYRKTDLDLGALLAQECQALRTACAERQLTLDAGLPATPLPLLADEARLRQLLHNLFSNALRYTDAGGTLRVRLAAQHGQAVLQVDDSKPAVPPELLPRLFERFFRVDASRSRASGGSGLGLAICRSIVLAHGGQIEAQASPLGGLGITVRLPLVRQTAAVRSA